MLLVNVFQKVVFPAPTSIFVNVMSFLSFVLLANGGLLEVRGKNVQYSKFFTSNNPKINSSPHNPTPKKTPIKISSKVGMFINYFPAFLFGMSSFLIFPNEGLRFFLLRLALTIHFFKRVIEVLFVHKYGDGGIALDATANISFSYLLTTVTMIYAQHLSREFPEPSIDLKYAGVGLFVLGIGGNFYHHYLLSTLRDKGEKEYKIPKGGLFNLVICPHYFFEVIGFLGVSCIAQTLYSLSFTVGSATYLLGRSYATRKWYLSKFEDFPLKVKSMVPFIF